jgi:pimeloyl-ACP methyl ester carboxylesterase
MDAPPVQYVKTSDGYDIACIVAGEGRPFVFMHSTFGSVHVGWKRYRRWMEGLAERFKLVSYDRRGWGLSTRGLPVDLTLDDLAEDLPAVIDGLQLSRLILYAFGGIGGQLATRYAYGHPERIDALIWNAASVTTQAFPQAQFSQLAVENWDINWGISRTKGSRHRPYTSCGKIPPPGT